MTHRHHDWPLKDHVDYGKIWSGQWFWANKLFFEFQHTHTIHVYSFTFRINFWFSFHRNEDLDKEMNSSQKVYWLYRETILFYRVTQVKKRIHLKISTLIEFDLYLERKLRPNYLVLACNVHLNVGLSPFSIGILHRTLHIYKCCPLNGSEGVWSNLLYRRICGRNTHIWMLSIKKCNMDHKTRNEMSDL